MGTAGFEINGEVTWQGDAMGTASRWSKLALVLPTAAFLALSWSPAQAQAAKNTARNSGQGLEEIVVTAQKRSENIQKVPISVTAFTAQMIKQRGLVSLSEIASYTPNLQFSVGASGTSDAANFFIRGIGQDDFITTTEPGVGVYVDGVYLARVTGADLDLADIQRVEVLRGPQGTLFGRNTIGGAINVITAKPTGQFGGTADITVGNQQTYNGKFMLNFPLIANKLAGKIAFMSNNTEGWGKNIWPGATERHLGRQSNVAGRAELLFDATDRLQFRASFDYTRNRGTTLPHGLVAFTSTASSQAFNQTAAVPLGPQYITADPNHIQIDTPTKASLDVYGTSLTGTWKGDGLNFKSITAYRWQHGLSGQDYDGTPAPVLDQVVNLAQWQFSQELQVYGNSFNDRLKWLAGLYYFEEGGRFDSNVILSGLPIFIDTRNKTNSYAAFGQATYKITDKLSVTAGARWTHERKYLNVMTDFSGFMLVPRTHRHATFSNVSPMGSVQYQATPDVMLYASISQGFRSGGFNGRPFSPADLTPFGPETVTSYEAGFKSEWFDHRLQINADGYYADYRDIQVTATTTDAAGNFIVVTGNAAKAKIYGTEIQVQARPTNNLHLFGSLGVAENSVGENPGFSFGAKVLPDTSKLNGSVGGDYSFPAGTWGEARLGGDYSYRSGFYPQYSETAPSYVKGYGLLNAQLTFIPNKGNWTLTFYGKNLTNQIYWTYGETAGTGDTTIAWFGRTRQWGANLEFHF